jgi:hypothetical protein
MDRRLIEYTPETETLDAESFRDAPRSSQPETTFDESEEMELTSGLLDVRTEAELDRFLGALVARAGRALAAQISSPAGQALTGVLKQAARQALPSAGRALGGIVGGRTGAQIGASAATAAGRVFGLEVEGLSPEDREFEITRSFVRFAGETVRTALTTRVAAPPQTVARSSAATAARRYAPGLLRSASPPLAGRWVRRGRSIVVVNS